MQRTEISSLGKEALLSSLRAKSQIQHPSTLRGQDEDALVLDYGAETQIIQAHRLLLEGIHFDLTYTPLKHLGFKAVISALSALHAMNGAGRQLSLVYGISGRFCVADVEELHAGVRHAAELYQLDIAMLDVVSSLTGLSISVVATGEAVREVLTTRQGARPTDLICVTGDLGAAYMGAQLLEREKRVFEGMDTEGFEPDFSGREYILERYLRPMARVDILTELRMRSVCPTSMLAITDGLAGELLHLSRESGVGTRIYEDRIPIDFETASMAEEFNLNVTTVALSGGEDYELLLTIPLGQMDQIRDIEGLRVIGHVTEPTLGNCLVVRDGAEIELRAQGWTGTAASN